MSEISIGSGRKPRSKIKEFISRGERIKGKAEEKQKAVAKAASIEAKKKAQEDRLRQLKEYSTPEMMRLSPSERDRLKYFSSWHFTLVMAGIGVLVAILFAMVVIAQGRYQLGLDVSRLTKEQERLQEINGQLKTRIEEMMVLEDLEVIARENLRLQTPQKGQIYEID
ncbi:MAG: hypothetical protein LBE38_08920 [Deltaproteobacteria bacterium]|jgi:Flp pilus assembly protein TadB|nr:hypothetical protein [Deltaproteobacteria bacterium]